MSDEEIAAQAAAEAMGETDGERDLKRKERLEQNRVSARESRKRKKQMIEGEFVPNCSCLCLFVPAWFCYRAEGWRLPSRLGSRLDTAHFAAFAPLPTHRSNVIAYLAYLTTQFLSNPNRSIISQNRTPANGHHPVPRQQGAQREERGAPPTADGHWRQGT